MQQRRASASILLGALLLLSALATAPVAAQLREEQPECFSSTDDYIVDELIVPIQPRELVTVRRYQGPWLKLFCISFEESSPQCATTAPTLPKLCSRMANETSAGFTCEDLTEFSAAEEGVNARIERGSTNGPDMIWLIKWDGTNQPVDCYPKVVTVRIVAFIYSDDQTSDAVLIVLSIIVGIVGIMIAISVYSFIANRLRQIDSAGAITVGGPGQQFRGPQMPVSAPGQQVVGQTRVLLPIRQGDGALNEMNSSRFGTVAQGGQELTTEEIILNRGPRARKSPPRPGDGVRDGMFPSPSRQRDRGGEFGDGEIDDLDGYESGGRRGGRRGRGGRGARGGRGGRGRREGSPSRRPGADFPVASDWETGDGGADRGEGPDGPRADAPTSVQQIRFIPQWHLGAFGRGDTIPQPYDGEELEERGPGFSSRTIDASGSGAKAFGVYKTSPTRQRRDENWGPGSGSGLKHRGSRGILKNTDPNTPGARRELDYTSDNDAYRGRGGRRGGRRITPRRLEGRLSAAYDDDEDDGEADNFRRDKSNLRSGAEIDPMNPTRSNRPTGPQASSQMLDASAVAAEGRDTHSAARPPPAAFQCKNCKVLLTGDSTVDPKFCVVNGEQHF